jgi:ankyrin repeat protein
MCRFASFKHNPKLVEVVVADWFSHGNTEKLTGKTELQGWYDGHYLMDGDIECRVPVGVDRVMKDWVKRQWPTFTDFIAWAIRNGADITARNEDGYTALHKAAEVGFADVVRALLSAGADANVRTKIGQTALIVASFFGYAEVVRLLLEFKADVNARNQWGNTALHRAAFANEADVVRLLIDAKADLNLRNLRNDQGVTALHEAERRNNFAVAEMLKIAGATL